MAASQFSFVASRWPSSFRSDVLLEELLLVRRVLQSHSNSLEGTAGDTRRAGRGLRVGALRLAALQRDDAERAVEAVYLRCCVLLAQRQKQLAQR